MISRLFDFSQITWGSLGLFALAIATVLAGDQAKPLLDELLPVIIVGKVIAGAKLVVLFALWKAYSPNFKPLAAPEKK